MFISFRAQLAVLAAATAALHFAGVPSPAAGQGMQNVIHSRARVFPQIGPGLSALKRDSAGHYYILAAPGNAIAIYGVDGQRIGQIPNATSHGATIKYAVDFDLDANGRLFVADRGANAIEIFESDGSLHATIPIVAPMSVAALSGGEFAVTTLQASHLVKIMDERGKLIRSFGTLPETAEETDGKPLFNLGFVSGDPAGHVYFTFKGLPDPTFRKYDRYGYAAYESSLPASMFGPQDNGRKRDVLVGVHVMGAGGASGILIRSGGTPEDEQGGDGFKGGISAGGTVISAGVGMGPRGGGGEGGGGTNPGGGMTAALGMMSGMDMMPGLGSMMPGMGLGMGMDMMPGMGRMMREMGPGGSGGEQMGGGPDSMPGGEMFGGLHGRFGGGLGVHGVAGTVRVNERNETVTTKPVIKAIGVDPVTEEVWAAIGDTLVHFTKDGTPFDSYYIATADGAQLEPNVILVEPNRILLAEDPLGIFEFARPDKASPSAPSH
jgi:hypothetical protein